MEFLYVMDYNSGRVCKIPVVTKSCIDVDLDALLKHYGLNENECAYMWHSQSVEMETLDAYVDSNC